MRAPRDFFSRGYSSFFFVLGHACGLTSVPARTVHAFAMGILPAIFLLRSTREAVYNVLWALVFGFATLNILSLGARRFEQARGLNFGEILAILVVLVSIILLAWEMLFIFGILPIHLTPR
jgi:hypothetical protein